MDIYLVSRYFHLCFILIMCGSVFLQAFLLRREISYAEFRRISQADMVYGISALLVVAIGLWLWFGTGKPAEYYSENPLFLTKVGLFIAVGLLSIYPTVYFMKQRKKAIPGEAVKIPVAVVLVARLELLLLLIIPLLAIYMASGSTEIF